MKKRKEKPTMNFNLINFIIPELDKAFKKKTKTLGNDHDSCYYLSELIDVINRVKDECFVKLGIHEIFKDNFLKDAKHINSLLLELWFDIEKIKIKNSQGGQVTLYKINGLKNR